MPVPKASRALSRFTVLDLTQVRSGPTCVRQLADWGANVIKIEQPPALTSGEPPGGPREGPDFQNLHRNKRAITLNLKAPEGLAAFKRMVKKADVVVENFRPDVKKRLKIDYKDLKKVNPKIILGSISGFGQDGPYAGRPGFDQIAQGMGGLMSVTGLPGQGPVRVGLPIADLCAGIFAAYGVTVALLERESSGKGQWLHTSLLEAMVYMMDFQTARWTIDGEVPGQAGNFHPTSIPTGVYKTRDGHINIAVFGGKIWERFAEVMGAPEWIQDERSKTKGARSVHRDWLNAEIEKRLVQDTSEHWIEKLNAAGVACGKINNIKEVFEEPQVQHLGILKKVVSSHLGEQVLMGQPVTLSRTPPRSRARRPGAASTPKRSSPRSAIRATSLPA